MFLKGYLQKAQVGLSIAEEVRARLLAEKKAREEANRQKPETTEEEKNKAVTKPATSLVKKPPVTKAAPQKKATAPVYNIVNWSGPKGFTQTSFNKPTFKAPVAGVYSEHEYAQQPQENKETQTFPTKETSLKQESVEEPTLLTTLFEEGNSFITDVSNYLQRGLKLYAGIGQEDYEQVLPVDEKVKHASETNEKTNYFEYQKLPLKDPGLYSYIRQVANKDSLDYFTGPSKITYKKEKNKNAFDRQNVEGIGHHLIMSVADDLTDFVSNAKLQEASRYIYQNTPSDYYIPIVRKHPGEKVKLIYRKKSDLEKEVNLNGEFIYGEPYIMSPFRLEQYKFGDLDFDKLGRNENFGFKRAKGVYNKKTKKFINNLVTDNLPSTYGAFSGGSAVFIFKNKEGDEIVKEVTGSLDLIRQEGEKIAQDFGIDKNDITIGVYDAGSVNYKRTADNNYNMSNKRVYREDVLGSNVGSSLLIPKGGKFATGGSVIKKMQKAGPYKWKDCGPGYTWNPVEEICVSNWDLEDQDRVRQKLTKKWSEEGISNEEIHCRLTERGYYCGPEQFVVNYDKPDNNAVYEDFKIQQELEKGKQYGNRLLMLEGLNAPVNFWSNNNTQKNWFDVLQNNKFKFPYTEEYDSLLKDLNQQGFTKEQIDDAWTSIFNKRENAKLQNSVPNEKTSRLTIPIIQQETFGNLLPENTQQQARNDYKKVIEIDQKQKRPVKNKKEVKEDPLSWYVSDNEEHPSNFLSKNTIIKHALLNAEGKDLDRLLNKLDKDYSPNKIIKNKKEKKEIVLPSKEETNWRSPNFTEGKVFKPWVELKSNDWRGDSERLSTILVPSENQFSAYTTKKKLGGYLPKAQIGNPANFNKPSSGNLFQTSGYQNRPKLDLEAGVFGEWIPDNKNNKNNKFSFSGSGIYNAALAQEEDLNANFLYMGDSQQQPYQALQGDGSMYGGGDGSGGASNQSEQGVKLNTGSAESGPSFGQKAGAFAKGMWKGAKKLATADNILLGAKGLNRLLERTPDYSSFQRNYREPGQSMTRGDWTTNQGFLQPNRMGYLDKFSTGTGSMQFGGEVEMTDDEIYEFLAAGGELEFMD